MNSEYKTPNNIHHNFPGLMEDSRLFTNYEQSSLSEKHIQEKFSSNSEYRRYLTDNASILMNKNKFSYLNNISKYVSNKDPEHLFNMRAQRLNNPYLFDNIHDSVQPYGYENNLTKSKYLSMEQLAAKTVNRYKH